MVLTSASSLTAQATRTWISGVGDDVNPCSRTAPCKTFAGAISKTAAGGEIDALDSGGFGSLTITKSITLDGGGTVAGILASGTNGIVINAGASDVVVLRNLDINGTPQSSGADARGVKFLAGKLLVIDHCNIYDFSRRGISIESNTNGAKVLISNSIIHDGLNNGIVVTPPVGITNYVTLDGVQSSNNGSYGLWNAAGGFVTVHNSTFGGNGTGGLHADGGAIHVVQSAISGNGSGVEAANGGQVTVSQTMISNNTGAAAVISTGGAIFSFGDNPVHGNAGGDSLGATPVTKQ